jgi:hypothetical protein
MGFLSAYRPAVSSRPCQAIDDGIAFAAHAVLLCRSRDDLLESALSLLEATWKLPHVWTEKQRNDYGAVLELLAKIPCAWPPACAARFQRLAGGLDEAKRDRVLQFFSLHPKMACL